MKKKHKTTFLLVLSCASLVSSIGFATWIVQPQDDYVINNKIQAQPVAYIVGHKDVKYTSIERALDVAKSGDIVCLIPPNLPNYHPTNNKVTPDQITYEISRDCEIKEGVTLIVPTDADTLNSVVDSSTLSTYIKDMQEDDRSRGEVGQTTHDTKASYGKYATDNEKLYLRVSVKIKAGKVLKNNGNLVVSGYLSSGASSGSGMRGQTSHSYSQILLEDGASLIQTNSKAVTYCYGYIKESVKNNNSFVDFKLGNIYIPLIVCDYKGFQFLSGIQSAVKEQGCSPFNQLEVRNIQSNVYFRYGSSLFGVTNIYIYQSAGTLGTVEQTLHKTFKLLGNSTDALINLSDSINSYLLAKFDNSTSILNMNFVGGIKLGNLQFKLTVKQNTISNTIDLDTKYAYFPLSYRMNIELTKNESQESAAFDFTAQKIKLLPGSTFVIHSNCNVSGDEIIVYSALIDGTNGQRPDVKWSAGPSYPTKNGAILKLESNSSITMNKIAGVVYCDDENNIKYTSSTITSKEAWNQKQSGLQYVTKDYLEIREKVKVVPLSYENRKKIFVGTNIFSDPSSSNEVYIPNFLIKSGKDEYTIAGTQDVVFMDEISDIDIQLVSNISCIKKSLQRSNKSYSSIVDYIYNEKISNSDNLVLCAINSDISISNNNNGVNEFDVQSITIKSLTNKIDGRDPLYVDGNIYLSAEIVDADKAYDKKVVWKSSDETIATIDQTGMVTGKSLGQVTFYASCGGVTSSYDTEVINDSTKIGVSDAWIVDDSGKSSKSTSAYSGDLTRPGGYGKDQYPTWNYSGKYKSHNGTTRFSLKYGPENAQITKVVWSFSGTTKNYMLDYDGNKTNSNTLDDNGSLSVTVKWDGYTNASPDGAVLKCTITDTTNKVTTVEFFILHDSGMDIPCIIEGTAISLSNGKTKKVEDLTKNDYLLAFDHEAGMLVVSKLFFNYHQNENNIVTAPILDLCFGNGTQICIHVDHGFFDLTLNKYVYINKDNYKNFINHEFVAIQNRKLLKTKLINGSISIKTVRVYSPVSEYNLNIVTNGLLSITGEIEGWFNYFEYDANLKYNEQKRKNDIEKYGLYTYDEFKDYIRKDIFDLLPIPYLKVSVGKGLTTKKQIIDVMKKYLSFM